MSRRVFITSSTALIFTALSCVATTSLAGASMSAHPASGTRQVIVTLKNGVKSAAVARVARAVASQVAIVDYNNGVSDLGSKKYSAAVSMFAAAIHRAPTFAEAFQARGLALSALGQYVPAISDENRAVTLRPTFAAAYAARGVIHYSLRQYSSALGDFSHTLMYDPLNAPVFYNRAMTYDKLRNNRAAIADYTAYLGLNASDPDAYYRRGIDRARQGDVAQARSDENQAMAYYNGAGNIAGYARAEAVFNLLK